VNPNAQPQAAVDRPMLVADVVAYAKKDCSRCHGSGFVIKVFHAGAEGESKRPDGCICAVRRFQKKNGDNIVMVNGAPFWKTGTAPLLQSPSTTA